MQTWFEIYTNTIYSGFKNVLISFAITEKVKKITQTYNF